MIVRGRATFTIERPDGTREVTEVGPNQALLIPRGAAHSTRVSDDLEVVFVSPRDGNVVWRER